MQPFSAGSVLGRSLQVWGRNFVPFVLIALVCNLPLFGYVAWVTSGDGILEVARKMEGYSWIEVPLRFVLGAIVTGATTFGVVQDLRGEPASVGGAFSRGLSSLPSIFGVTLVLGVVVGLGFVLLIVPGLILLTMLWVAVPAAVMEDAGVTGALSRSQHLTEGNRWSVFALAVLLFGLAFGVNKLLERVLVGAVDGASMTEILSRVRIWAYGSVLVTSIVGSFQAVVAAVAYCDLRQTKEGVATDELAKIFG